MARKQGRERALGPYEHGSGWRVLYIAADGRRSVGETKSRAEAEAERDEANLQAGNRSVGEAVREYLDNSGYRASGVETARHRLLAMLRLREGDRPLVSLTAQVARELYRKRTTEVANDTHHGELGYVKRFADWCVKQGWLRLNPFADVQQVGEKKRGKPKLRVNATRQFMATVMADESLEATAVLTALTLALRASEVVNRTVEDLDDDGRILWIRDSKTEGSDREIEIPEFLRARLLKLAAGKGPTDRLFGEMSRHALYHQTVKFCRLAGVNRVTPHGLRGSGATQAVRVSGGVEAVARALGHVDDGDTLRAHYLGGGAEESARGRKIETLIKVEIVSPGVDTGVEALHDSECKPYETASDLN